LGARTGAQDLVARLAEDDGTLAKQLFGSEQLPRDIFELVGTYRKIEGGLIEGPFPEWNAQKTLSRAVDAQAERTKVYRDAVFKQYQSGMHETEAAVIERMAQEEARRVRAARGAGVDVDIPTSVKQPDRTPSDALDFSDEVPTAVLRRKGVVA